LIENINTPTFFISFGQKLSSDFSNTIIIIGTMLILSSTNDILNERDLSSCKISLIVSIKAAVSKAEDNQKDN